MNTNYLISSSSLSTASSSSSAAASSSSSINNLNEQTSLKNKLSQFSLKQTETNTIASNPDEAKSTLTKRTEESTAATSSIASSSNAAPSSNSPSFDHPIFDSANLVNYTNTAYHTNNNHSVFNMLPSIQQQQQQQQQQQSQFMAMDSNLSGMMPSQMTPIHLHQQQQQQQQPLASNSLQPLGGNGMMLPIGYQQTNSQMPPHSNYQMNYPYFYQQQQQQQHNFYNNMYGGGVQPQYHNGQLLPPNMIGPPNAMPQSHNILPPPPLPPPLNSNGANGTAISHNINDLLKSNSEQLNSQAQKSDSVNLNLNNNNTSPSSKTNGPTTPKSRKKSEVK